MRLHRFYIKQIDGNSQPLGSSKLWINDEKLLNQWLKVFRFKVGQELILFNDERECLYKIVALEKSSSVQLEHRTDLTRKVPKKHIYLFWSLLKSDKNEWIMQKCTELGIRNFVPLITERCEKTSFNIERASKIVIEAAEQCGRSDIPHIREPLTLKEALSEYSELQLIYMDQHQSDENVAPIFEKDTLGLLIGPEGGWSDSEIKLFHELKLETISLGELTLRAETAAIVATSRALT
jgi:16S rRNA (uracil1498-N3)-methyltransferase